MVQHSLMDSAAWLDLSGVAVKLLLLLMKRSEGNNGWGHKEEPGQLYLSERQAAEAIGISRNTASKALAELVEHGFLRIVQAGHFDCKVKLATIWRLTFEPYPRAHQGPTNEWLKWQPEQKARAQNLNGSGPKSDQPLSKPPTTGAKAGPDDLRNGENPPKPTGSKTAPHIDMPRGGDGRELAKASDPLVSSLHSAGGRFRPEAA